MSSGEVQSTKGANQIQSLSLVTCSFGCQAALQPVFTIAISLNLGTWNLFFTAMALAATPSLVLLLYADWCVFCLLLFADGEIEELFFILELSALAIRIRRIRCKLLRKTVPRMS